MISSPKPAQRSRSARNWPIVLFGMAVLCLYVFPTKDRVLRGQNDYVGLYIGGKLLGTPGLYSREANIRAAHEAIGTVLTGVAYIRPAFHAVLLKPLTLLPYQLSFWVFTVISLASMLWFVRTFARDCPELPVLASFSLPIAGCLANGQDTLIVLALAGLSILLARQGRDFVSGMVLSLCTVKFHLFLLIPVLVVATRRWRILQGGAAGCALLVLAGFAAAGFNWIPAYLHAIRDPWVTPCLGCMPNVHGAVFAIAGEKGSLPLEIALSSVVAAFCVVGMARSKNYEYAFAISLIGGVLLSYHIQLHDLVILLLPLALIIRTTTFVPLRGIFAIAVTPPANLLLFLLEPYNAVLGAVLFALVVLAALGTRYIREAASEAG
jgi:glycosyl transferase family 87